MTDQVDQVLTKVDLTDDGLLWALNTSVLHPRGLALVRTPEGSFYLMGDGQEVWVFEEGLAQEKKDALDAVIAGHLAKFEKGNPDG